MSDLPQLDVQDVSSFIKRQFALQIKEDDILRQALERMHMTKRVELLCTIVAASTGLFQIEAILGDISQTLQEIEDIGDDLRVSDLVLMREKLDNVRLGISS